jgi:hypothetical protein
VAPFRAVTCRRRRRCRPDDGGVLRDADRSLANFLRGLLPPGVGLRFETPNLKWQTHPPEPLFVSAFLHSVRQDDRGGQAGWSEVRDDDGRITGRQAAAAFFRLAYLITAWSAPDRTADPAEQAIDEHEALGSLLVATAHRSVLPADCLEGTLAGNGTQSVVECAPAGSPSDTSPLWAGLGITPRAHFELVLITSSVPPVITDLAPPVRELILNASQDAARPAPGGSFDTVRRWHKHQKPS